jgi:hypothetical protein
MSADQMSASQIPAGQMVMTKNQVAYLTITNQFKRVINPIKI